MILRFIERNVLKQINSMKSPRVFGTLHAKCLSNAHAGLSSGSNLVLDEDKIVHDLNSLPVEILKDFRNFGIEKARRVESYRQHNDGLKSIQDLGNIDGFTPSIVKSIQQKGLVLKKKGGYTKILKESEDVKSITAITIGSHEICWCSITKQLQVVSWVSEEWKREKGYLPKTFISKVEKLLEKIPQSDINVIESQSYKSSSRDPAVFPYILHSRLTEALLHSLSKVKTVSLDPNIIRRHFDLSKGFNKQYYSVALVNDLVSEELKRDKKVSTEEVEQNVDKMNALPGCTETVSELVCESGKKSAIFQGHEKLDQLSIPEDFIELYANKQRKEGLGNAILLALTFLELEILKLEK